MTERDTLHRFLIERTNVRGEWVHLDATWRAVQERAEYPLAVRRVLGEALAAVALLAATIKFEGSLILQIQGDGPLSLLVVQATGRRTVRGLARWRDEVPQASLREQFGEGRMVITIDQGTGKDRYQGVVGLSGATLAQALDDYFSTSEQLPTRLWLAADSEAAGGLLLQGLPAASADPDAWNRAITLAETLTPDEILGLDAGEVLHRLYHEEDVRLFDREPVSFRCGCSRERVQGVIRGLGLAEARSILEEQGAIEVDCEFCNAHYSFDAVDVEHVFAASEQPEAPSTRH
jgi:molecular chaperone Hsp33